MQGILAALVAVAVGICSSFGSTLISPFHDGGSGKTLESVSTVSAEGYSQQYNISSSARMHEDRSDVMPETEAEDAPQELIDVRRKPALSSSSGSVSDLDQNGNISVLTSGN